MNELKVDEGLVVTEEYEATEEIKRKKVRFVPLWKGLLDLR